jgi:hypothetical protein
MGKSVCFTRVDELHQMSQEDLMGLEVEARGMADALIGQPVSPKRVKLENKYKKSGSKRDRINLEREKKREKEHRIFHDLIVEGIMMEKMRIHQSAEVEVIAEGYEEAIGYHHGRYTGKLYTYNSKQIHDYRKTLERHLNQLPKDSNGDFSNTIQNQVSWILRRDKSGYGIRLIKAAKSLGETVIRRSLPYVRKAEEINEAIRKNMGSDEKTEAFMKHMHDTMDGRKRNIRMFELPKDSAESRFFIETNIGKKYLDMMDNLTPDDIYELPNEDGSVGRYVMIRLDNKNDIAQYNLIYGGNEHLDSIMWLAVPAIEGTEQQAKYDRGTYSPPKLMEGWYEAGNWEVKSVVVGKRGTVYRNQGYSSFGYMNKQPDPAYFKKKEKSEKSEIESVSMWEAIAQNKALLKEFYDHVQKQQEIFYREYEPWVQRYNQMLKMKWGEDTEGMKKEAEQFASDLGVFGMLSVSQDGTLVSFHNEVNEIDMYSPIRYRKDVKVAMMIEKYDELDREINEIEANLSQFDKAIKRGAKNNDPDLASMMENTDKLRKTMATRMELRDLMLKMARQQMGMDPFESTTMQVSHLQHRSLWTDKMQRDRSPSLIQDYFEDMVRAMETNNLKLQAMQTMLVTGENLHGYLMNEVKEATGSMDTAAGFLGLNYSDEAMMKRLHTLGIKIDPELYRHMLGWHRGVISGWNLGFLTAAMNNFQRVNYFIDYGWDLWHEAQRAIQGKGRYSNLEVLKFVEDTGVLDLSTQFTDWLLAGANTSETKPLGFIIPVADIKRMVLGKRGGMDKALAKASGKEKLQLEELDRLNKKMKILLETDWKPEQKELLRQSIKDLKFTMTDEYIGRIVDWRLNWFPFQQTKAGGGIAEAFTMGGTERNIRTLGAVMGFIEAERRGMLDTTKDDYFNQDAAIAMARTMVYHTQFAFDPINSPKFMRGAFGRFYWQFKQYQYFQAEHDFKTLQNMWVSTDGNGMARVGRMGARVTAELLRMGASSADRGLGVVGIDVDPNLERDETARSLIRFFMTRGLMSMVSAAIYVPILTEIYRFTANRVVGAHRGVRGLESPMLVYPLRLAKLGLMMLRGGFDEDEEERTRNEVLMDWVNPLVNLLIGLGLGNPYAPTAYIPPVAKTGYKYYVKEELEY